MMSKEELRVMENSKELWDKEPTDNGQRSTRLNAEEGYTCNLKQTSLPKNERFLTHFYKMTKTNLYA